MYESFYGLDAPPFSLTPDPRFLFLSAQHREALDHLLFGIKERKGFIQLTGEVGAGKTTLCRALLEELGPSVQTALIFNTSLTGLQLLRAILRELGLPYRGNDRDVCIDTLNGFLLEQAQADKDVVIIVDEAQNLSDELLEQVRMLSNLETDQRKLVQIVLMGQPELRAKLDQPKLRQLRQRITVRYHLGRLSLAETEAYIHHRLRIAGPGNIIFTRWALRRIHFYSKGVPRLVNALCDKTLLCGFVKNTHKLNLWHVQRAVAELEGKSR